MFPGMRELQLTDTKWNTRPYERLHLLDRVPYMFEGEDISRLVTCCPNLKTLCVPGTVQPGADFSPLLQLNRLAQLELKGAAVTDDTAASVSRQLTSLQHLDITYSDGVTDVSLLSLTTLRQLTRLRLLDCGLKTEEGYRGLRAGSLIANQRQHGNVSHKQQRPVAADALALYFDI
jgi:hypothetical protein